MQIHDNRPGLFRVNIADKRPLHCAIRNVNDCQLCIWKLVQDTRNLHTCFIDQAK